MARTYADDENGGWFASLDFAGQVTDTTKDNYAHAHALLAASTAIAAGLTGAEDVFAATAAAINLHFWSDAEGRARDSWNAGFTELEPYRGANSNMHSVEAYLAAGDASGDPVWHERALSIAAHLIDGHARANHWRVPEHYDQAWRPLPDYNDDRRADQFRPYGTTPGHSFEWARLLLDLEAALTAPGSSPAPASRPAPPAWLLEAATALFDAAVADAEDRDGHPGLLYTVDSAGQPVITSRLHWVACEAVLAADALHRRTADERFAAAATRWWAEIDRYFIDRESGGWHHELTPELTPAAGTWSGKPDLYHAYQALLFPSLPLTPTAARALTQHPSPPRPNRPKRRIRLHRPNPALTDLSAATTATSHRCGYNNRNVTSLWLPRPPPDVCHRWHTCGTMALPSMAHKPGCPVMAR